MGNDDTHTLVKGPAQQQGITELRFICSMHGLFFTGMHKQGQTRRLQRPVEGITAARTGVNSHRRGQPFDGTRPRRRHLCNGLGTVLSVGMDRGYPFESPGVAVVDESVRLLPMPNAVPVPFVHV